MSSTAAQDNSTLAQSAGLIGFATMISRVLGLARDQVIASFFCAGNAMDAFLIAFRISNLLRDLFAEGAMSAAFVPTFARELALGGKPRAWQLGRNLITALLVITVPLAVVGVLVARPIVQLYAGDYARVPGKLELTISLTRIMSVVGLESTQIALTFGKIMAAAGVMAVSAWAVERMLRVLAPGTGTVAYALQVGAAVGAGLIVLGASAHALRIAEFAELRRTVRMRRRRAAG